MHKTTFIGCIAALFAATASAYEIAPAPLLTEWGEKMTPETAWREYPRPQMVRGNWTNLNGLWDYAITSNVEHRAVTVATGKILVPFAFESPLSGVGRLIAPHEKMVYTRQIDVHPKKGMRTLLNFEAVDWRASVYVNGIEAMDAPHEGGNLPFTVDITPFVREGSNELKVVAWDPTHTFINAGGKQNDKTKGCFYTRVSGIWQTVWMEEVPERHIESYKVVTDIDRGEVKIEVKVKGEGEQRLAIAAFDGDKKIGEFTPLSTSACSLHLDSFECWSPENPKLYGFTAKCGADEVRGYFAMRKIDKAKDEKGNWRFRLNNKFVFPMGTLDQGWWPDGLLTPPSLAACEHDIRTLKACGFNMMRKHIKVEPRLYYHLCDKLGLMVFQDAPSPAGNDNIFDDAKSLQRYGMFRREWKEEMDHLFNVPSIVMWIPYNESWGQPDADYTDDTLRWTKRYDPTRLVGGPSGWSDFEGGDSVVKGEVVRDASAESDNPAADTVDQHNYPGPGQCKSRKNRISLLGEFGGLGLKVPGHLWDEKGVWGYAGTGEVISREANQQHYLDLMDKLIPLVEDGLAGTVYTQTTDVELEINGLMTYDRKVLKYNPEVLKAAHRKIKEGVEKCESASLLARADVKVGSCTKWAAFKDDPLYLDVKSPCACKVQVDGKLQGWMPGGEEARCFKLVSGRGWRSVNVVAAETNAEISAEFVPSADGRKMADAICSDVAARCTEGGRWLYRIPAGKRLSFKLDGRFRGFPTADVFCEHPGKMTVRWGDRQMEVVGKKLGSASFQPVALGETDTVEFYVESGEFHLIGVGFTRVGFPPTVDEMQEMCQRLCDKAVAEGLQGGVQFCAYRDGRKIVDVCAGHLTTNADSAAVTSDTLFPIFSTEKPLLSTACHRAVERGLMDYDKPLCTWWPELKGDGKEKLTLRETLGYRTCLPGGSPGGKGNPVCDHALSDRELCDWDLVCRVAAADKPHGIPGTVQAYLPYAYAWMVGHPLEVAMKKPLKQVLDEEVLIPSGIEKEFYFVVPRSEYPRVAKFYYGQFCENMNEDWARQALLPSAWAVSSARALGKFYNRLCGFDGLPPLIRKETLDAALKPCRHPSDPLPSAVSMKRDWFMLFGMGYGLWGEAERMDRVFGHGGAGGSEALVDRDQKLIVAFTCNFCKNCNPLRDRLYEVVGLRWRYWNGGVNIQDLQMTTSSGGSFGAGITSH